jgi:Family of unknown function (DUF5519)
MADSDTRALWVPDEVASGPPEAFIDDHEFCHIHALPEGSLHLTLPLPLRERLVGLGWGEMHPGAEAGFFSETLVMVYAPRTEEEAAAVLYFVTASYDFALGVQPAATPA